MKFLDSTKIELVVMGPLLRSLDWYREQFPNFVYERPRPHFEVLQLMQRCDIFVLPSIVEGRALVQQEAMALRASVDCDKKWGGDDLIIEGETGFLVPYPFARENCRPDRLVCVQSVKRLWHGYCSANPGARTNLASYGEQIVAATRQLINQ